MSVRTRRRTCWWRTAALVLMSVHPVSAQRETPPAAGAPRNTALPRLRRFTLPNGLKVTLVPYGSVPKVTVALAVPASIAEEASNQVWLSEITGTLLTEGTTRRSAASIAEEASAMGGGVSVWTDRSLTWMEGDALSEHTTSLIDLMADMALRPRFSEATLERAKADRARAMAVAQARAYRIAWTEFVHRLYGEHRYGLEFPTQAQLAGYTLAQVKQFYARNFGATRSHLYVVGVFDLATTETAVRRAFRGWSRGTSAPVIRVGPPAGVRSLTLIDRPDAVQSSIVMGLRIPAPSDSDHAAFEVTDALLGGIWTSRITSNIREQRGYAYAPGSLLNSFRGETFWSEQADVTTSATGASLREIIGEMDRLRAEMPTVAELDGIKNNLVGNFVRLFGTQRDVIGELSFVDVQELGDDYLAGYVKRILAVTPATVQRIARAYLDPDRMTIVVVGDKRTVESQLIPFRTVRR